MVFDRRNQAVWSGGHIHDIDRGPGKGITPEATPSRPEGRADGEAVI